GSDLRSLPGTGARPETTLPHRAYQSVYNGGSSLLRAHRQTFHRRSSGENEGGGSRFLPRRRRGNISSAREKNYLRSQNQRPDVAEHGEESARSGPSFERYHAIRPRRNGRGARRPPHQVA